MIAYLSIENFLSLKNKAAILFTPNSRFGINHVLKNDKLDVLQFSSFFGANGSGKTNIVLAVEYIKELVYMYSDRKRKSRSETGTMTVCPFSHISDRDRKMIEGDVSNRNSGNSISKFEIVIILDEVYSYSFSYDSNSKKVVSEELSILCDDKNSTVFSRIGDELSFDGGTISTNNHYIIDYNGKKSEITIESNRLLINSILNYYTDNCTNIGDLEKTDNIIRVAKYLCTINISSYEYKIEQGVAMIDRHNLSYQITTWYSMPAFKIKRTSVDIVSRILSKLTDIDHITMEYAELDNISIVMTESITDEDGLCNIAVDGDNLVLTEIMTDNKKPYRQYCLNFVHKKTNNIFSFGNESSGVQKIVNILLSILSSVDHGIYPGTIIVDEMCYSLNPRLSAGLLNELKSEFNKCQFIFTMHSSQLLDRFFRPDEIWLVDNDGNGSFVKSINDYSPEYIENLRNSYLDGRYGAIPPKGDF